MATSHDRDQPSFQISQHEDSAANTLLAGFAGIGLAGLTTANHLVDHLDLNEIGHITTSALPAITPFEDGTPRHHSRLFSRDDLDLVVLVNELFVPLRGADPFADAVVEWTESTAVDEITVLAGIPYPHGPADHRVFYVATEDYQDKRLYETDISAMGQGFLDGVNARLIARGMDSALRTGVFVTPVHAQAPDVDAAIRLLEAVNTTYGLEIDAGPLEQFATEVQQYYAQLAERLQGRDVEQPDDRMYM
jgi:uncharacterized protein